MKNLEDLIEIAQKLSTRLEESANDEKCFCFDIQMRLDQLACQMWKTANELKYINEYL